MGPSQTNKTNCGTFFRMFSMTMGKLDVRKDYKYGKGLIFHTMKINHYRHHGLRYNSILVSDRKVGTYYF